jgi:hypothetical protein
MYPAQSIADGLIFEDDTPNSILLNDIELSKNGLTYGDININGVTLIENKWVTYINGEKYSERNCLIQSSYKQYQGKIKDNFPDVFFISATNSVNPNQSFNNFPLIRRDTCLWSGPEGPFLVYQGRYPFGSFFRDYWLTGGGPPSYPFVDGTVPINNRLNTPVGQYENRFNYSNIVVSE